MSHLARALPLLLAASLLAPLAAADVLVVDGQGGGDFTDIHPAILAAADGDVILVRPFGAYGPFQIQDKSLVVAADGGPVVVAGNSKVRDLSAGKLVVLSGLTGFGDVSLGPGLTLLDNAGSVRVQDCAFQGATNTDCQPWPIPGDGRPGAWVSGCADVAFRATLLTGGAGKGGSIDEPCYIGGTGGQGLLAVDSGVTLHDSSLQGGRGGDAASVGLGGNGGHGLDADGGSVLLAGSTAAGGAGGIGDDFFPIDGYGNGGDGLVSSAATTVRLLAATLLGGAAGASAFGVPGDPGQPADAAGPLVSLGGAAAELQPDALARESEVLDILLSGTPGSSGLLLVQLGPGLLSLPEYGGSLLLGLPLLLEPLFLGSVPPSGTLAVSFPIPELGPGFDAIAVHLQAALSEGPGWRLSGAGVLVLLDGAF